MKILYATQKTGNGHLARAQELIPILKKYAEVDVLTSGSHSQLQPDFDVKFSYGGISLFYGKKGGLSYSKILKKNSFISFFKNVFDVPIHEYDLIINDFEPITAWAAKLRGYQNIVALSHQASILFPKTPRPLEEDTFGDFILKYYAPVHEKYGFHFQKYNEGVFTPVIRQKIKNLKTSTEEKYVVYLPAYSAEEITERLRGIPTHFKVFSNDLNNKDSENCTFYNINEDTFLEEIASCKGVLCSAGFELPAESLFLKKKLFLIPIKNQREQQYNAKALELLGIPVDVDLHSNRIKDWVSEELIVKLDFPDISEILLKKIIEKHK